MKRRASTRVSRRAVVTALAAVAAAAAVACRGAGRGAASPPSAAPAAPLAPVASRAVLDELAAIVAARFYSAAHLEKVGWRTSVAAARGQLVRAPDSAARVAILRALLASLHTSHTDFYPRAHPSYWALASIFEPVLQRTCARDRVPALPITHEDIGVFWKQLEDGAATGGAAGWFVGGVYAGGPAAQAGLLLGDRVVAADGQPFSPGLAFTGKAGKAVVLTVQRRRDAAPLTLTITPRASQPQEELRQATADSWRMIERGGKRVAYLHVWSWTSVEVQQVVLESIARANAAAVDGFILDLRDGWGGAAPHYLSIFWRDVPVLEQLPRAGAPMAYDAQLRKPTVVLINGGTRSGKEVFAHGVKRHQLARLVGERTAGAVNFGQPFCLPDGSLLLLAVADARVDGERLEGRGVPPDLELPLPLRYAAGQDAQLERALEVLTAR